MSASAQITDNGSALGGRLGSMSLTRQMSRQMSIYSLTLDEFQSALGEPAKNFGSMNMDDLLKNIWTAEESQAMAALFSNNDPASTSSLLPRQPSIQRQNSVTLLPLPQALSKKTVEEVWKDIAGGGGGEPSSNGGAAGGGGAGEFGEPNIQAMKPRQSTYGEMTLEDFLVKAGVMTADPVADVVPVVHPFSNNQHYGGGAAGGGAVVTTSGYGNVETAAPSRMMNMMLEQKQQQQNLQPILGAMTGLLPSSGKKEPIELNDPVLGIGLGPSNFSAGASSSNGYLTTYNNNQAAKQQAEWMDSQYKSAQQQQQQQQQLMQLQAAAGYMNGAGTSNGLGIGGGMSGYGPGAIVTKEGSPGSPLSDAQGYGLSPNGNYGLDVPLRGRKRILDAPLEKIVERRQRRMIKNRESAARSRARKQAYTVELEAEVTQLKEENMRLRKMQVRVQEEENSKKKKQVLEVIAPMTRHLPKMLRRTVTGPW